VCRARTGQLRCWDQRRDVIFGLRPSQQNLDLAFRAVLLDTMPAIARSSPASCAVLRLAPLWCLPLGLVQILLVIAKHLDGYLVSLRFLRDEISFSPLTDVPGEALLDLDGERRVGDAERGSRFGDAGDARCVRVVTVRQVDEVSRAAEDRFHPLGQHISVDDRHGQARDRVGWAAFRVLLDAKTSSVLVTALRRSVVFGRMLDPSRGRTSCTS